MGFKTDAIHAGQEPDPTTGAVTIPIYQTSTYVQEGLGKHKGFEYARTQNPTRMALERNMAVLERAPKPPCSFQEPYVSGFVYARIRSLCVCPDLLGRTSMSGKSGWLRRRL